MSSPAFAAALQSVVLNKTPKPATASSARSVASPGMSKGDDLMAALVARISARRRRMTNTVFADNKTQKSSDDGKQATSDWSDSASADSDDCPTPKRLAAEIVKRIPWSNGRARIDPSSAASCNLSGVHESETDGGAHSRSATPMLLDKVLDLSGTDGQDRVNCSNMSSSSIASNMSCSSIASASGAISSIGGLLQPEPYALSDNITSRRGSRGYHIN
jgi:hypothetical protein